MQLRSLERSALEKENAAIQAALSTFGIELAVHGNRVLELEVQDSLRLQVNLLSFGCGRYAGACACACGSANDSAFTSAEDAAEHCADGCAAAYFGCGALAASIA